MMKELKPTYYFTYAICGLLVVMYLILKKIYPASTEPTFIICIVNLGLPLAIIIILVLILGELITEKEDNGEK